MLVLSLFISNYCIKEKIGSIPTQLNYSSSSYVIKSGVSGYTIAPTVDWQGNEGVFTLTVTPASKGITISPLKGVINWSNNVDTGKYVLIIKANNHSGTSEEYLIVFEVKTSLPIYTLTYDSKGGTAINLVSNVAYASSITPPANPIKKGYTFGAWYTSKDGGSTLADSMIFSNGIRENMVLYAKWNANANVNVEFDINGGIGTKPNSQVVQGGFSATNPNATISKPGFAFGGWSISGANPAIIFENIPITQPITFKAIWNSNASVVVNFDANGAVGPTPSSQNVQGGLTAFKPPILATKAGYNFNGWSVNGNLPEFNFGLSINENTTFRAIWLPNASVSVSFDLNSGLGTTPPTQSVQIGLQATAPNLISNPTKAGYGFGGWAMSSTLTTPFSFSSAVDHALTLYAIWLLNGSVAVNFNLNGANGAAPASQAVTAGLVATKPSTIPTRPGYTFLYWSLTQSPSSNLQFDFTQPINDGSITLYSIWSPNNPVDVAFDLNNGVATTTAPILQHVPTGLQATEPAEEIKRQGWVFKGWSLSGSLPAFNFANAIEAASTFKAIWQANDNISVKFDINSATGTSPTEQAVQGGLYAFEPISTSFAKTGYFFGGWKIGDAISNFDFANTAISSPITLMATWTPNQTQAVTFNTNDGTNTIIETQNIQRDLTATAPTIIPIRAGYVFAHWSASDALEATAFSFASPITNPIILYANWTANATVNITFDLNGGTGTAPTTQSIFSGQNATNPTVTEPEKNGHSFIGWNIANNSTSGIDFATSPITSSITLYAVWQYGAVLPSSFAYASNPNTTSINFGTEGYSTTPTIDTGGAVVSYSISSISLNTATITNSPSSVSITSVKLGSDEMVGASGVTTGLSVASNGVITYNKATSTLPSGEYAITVSVGERSTKYILTLKEQLEYADNYKLITINNSFVFTNPDVNGLKKNGISSQNIVIKSVKKNGTVIYIHNSELNNASNAATLLLNVQCVENDRSIGKVSSNGFSNAGTYVFEMEDLVNLIKGTYTITAQ